MEVITNETDNNEQQAQNFEYFKGALSGLRHFMAMENPLKLIRNTYFTLKALFVLKIFKFLP